MKIDPNKIIPHGEMVAAYKAQNERLKAKLRLAIFALEEGDQYDRSLAIEEGKRTLSDAGPEPEEKTIKGEK